MQQQHYLLHIVHADVLVRIHLIALEQLNLLDFFKIET